MSRSIGNATFLMILDSQVDSLHFWDLMDALPVEAIEQIEQDSLKRVKREYALESDTLHFDTTNLPALIATTSKRSTTELARRFAYTTSKP